LRGVSLPGPLYHEPVPTVVAGSGSTALAVVLVLAIVFPALVLAVVCVVFWKAKRREDADRRGTS
jgi:hypothetical protein